MYILHFQSFMVGNEDEVNKKKKYQKSRDMN